MAIRRFDDVNITVDFNDEEKDTNFSSGSPLSIIVGKIKAALKNLQDLENSKFSKNGGTITVGDLKNNIPNGKVFHITQSTANPESGTYMDGNESMQVSSLTDDNNVLLGAKYEYASGKYDYLGEQYPLGSGIAASNLVNGVAMYRNFDNARNFRVYAVPHGTTKSRILGHSSYPWDAIYVTEIHSKTVDDIISQLTNVQFAMCEMYENLNNGALMTATLSEHQSGGYMSKIYADLVINDQKTLEQVPANLRNSVEKNVAAIKEEQAIREETERAQAENAFLDELIYDLGESPRKEI